MFTLDFDYLLLNIVLLLVFTSSGYNIGRKGSYRGNTFWCIVTFSLILGLRFARSHDYFHYVDTFKYNLNSENQPLFTIFNNFLKYFGISEYSCFIVYAFVFIVSSFIFLKEYKKYAQYILPVFLITMIAFEEAMIRQAFGFSFVFLALSHFFKILKTGKVNYHHLIFFIIYTGISHYIHSANSLVLFVIVSLYFLIKTTFPVIITIPVFIFATYILPSIFDFSILTPILSILGNSNEHYASYTENSEIWFSSSGIQEQYTRNEIVRLFETAGNVALLYLGSKIIHIETKDNRQVVTLYNTYFVGTTIQKAFMNLEILNRMGGVLGYFSFIPLSIVLYYHKKYDFGKNRIFFLFLLWWIYDYLKFLFFRGDMTKFLWDM